MPIEQVSTAGLLLELPRPVPRLQTQALPANPYCAWAMVAGLCCYRTHDTTLATLNPQPEGKWETGSDRAPHGRAQQVTSLHFGRRGWSTDNHIQGMFAEIAECNRGTDGKYNLQLIVSCRNELGSITFLFQLYIDIRSSRLPKHHRPQSTVLRTRSTRA